MITFAIIVLLLFLVASILSILPYNHWVFRTWDFPRLQLIVVAIIGLSIATVTSMINGINSLLLALVIISSLLLLYQLFMVFPYTRLAGVSVRQVKQADRSAQVSLLVSNVLMQNDNTSALLDLVETYQPDIVLTLESDKKWQDALDVLADKAYHHSVKVPLDNLYGMHLYSRLALKNASVNYLVSEDIPSITATVTLRNGTDICLYCLHPEPPSPSEATTSKKRDAELLIVAREISQVIETCSPESESSRHACILAGDLNDVAWSKSTKLFQRVSNMRDPRKGRGFFNTFHAKYPFMRWALDHVFVTDSFELVGYERLESIGSDHFPVLTTLQHIPHKKVQNTSTDIQDAMDAMDKIALGKDEARSHNCSPK